MSIQDILSSHASVLHFIERQPEMLSLHADDDQSDCWDTGTPMKSIVHIYIDDTLVDTVMPTPDNSCGAEGIKGFIPPKEDASSNPAVTKLWSQIEEAFENHKTQMAYEYQDKLNVFHEEVMYKVFRKVSETYHQLAIELIYAGTDEEGSNDYSRYNNWMSSFADNTTNDQMLHLQAKYSIGSEALRDIWSLMPWDGLEDLANRYHVDELIHPAFT